MRFWAILLPALLLPVVLDADEIQTKDGKKFFTWKPDWSRVSTGDPRTKDPKVLGVGLSSSTYKVHKLTVTTLKN